MIKEISHKKTLYFELIPNKVGVKIYNREFDKSTQYYLQRGDTVEISEIEKNHRAVLENGLEDHGSKAKSLCILNQIHSAEIVYTYNRWDIGQEPRADGLYTDKSDIMLGILTADCVPVLIASECGTFIGGIHCGWKSALSGIVENYSGVLTQKVSSSLVAAIGPSIHQKSYEVDIEYYNDFIKKSSEYGKYFIKKNEVKYLFDLPSFVIARLETSGIKVLKHFNENTFDLPAKYPSNRYSFVNNLGKYKGEILSSIFKIYSS